MMKLNLAPKAAGVTISCETRGGHVTDHFVCAMQRRALRTVDRVRATAVTLSIVRRIGSSSSSSTRSSSCRPLSLAQISRPAKYNAIELDLTVPEPALGVPEFAAQCSSAVARWRAEGKSSVWLKLPLTSEFFPAAAAAGFTFHNAEGHVATLLLWLEDRPCSVPPFATHQVGVAGVVVDSNMRLLVCKDRHKNNAWKFPGGLADLGEDIGATAVREVFEETGVRASFRSILAFRHLHSGYNYGRSDMYFLALCDAQSEEIEIDPVELLAARWMDAREFMTESTHPLNRWVAATVLRVAAQSRDGIVANDDGTRLDGTKRMGSWGQIIEEDVFIPVAGRKVKCYRAAETGDIGSLR